MSEALESNDTDVLSWGLLSDSNEWDSVCYQNQDAASQENWGSIIGNLAEIPAHSSLKYLDYQPLCATINSLFDQCGGKYTMRVTRYDHEPGSHAKMVPDLCVYERAGPAENAFAFNATGFGEWTSLACSVEGSGCCAQDEEDSENDVNDDCCLKRAPLDVLRAIQPYRARTAWAWITTFVQVERDQSCAPYKVENGKLMLVDSVNARRTRTRTSKYVSEVFLRQPRNFFFTLVLVQSTAYLMRWDRGGTLVASAFDYVCEPKKLLKFFYQIAIADRSGQGYDPTVALASSHEVDQLKAYRDTLPPDSVLRKYVDRSLIDEVYFPVCKVICTDVETLPRDPSSVSSDTARYMEETAVSSLLNKELVNPSRRTHVFLIGKHHHGSRSLVGRGGKGFVAYDMEHRRSVFMKDYWYADRPTAHPETEVYQKLARAKVRNVATLLAGGDVADFSGCQETLTKSRTAKRRHHRLVVKEIGQPLESYRNGRELIQALYDALLAHRDAWEKAEILHGDVSMNNILINITTGKAFLNDWDLCKYMCELREDASQNTRSGTWPYMSALLVDYPRKPNELADDVESFLYIYTLSILRFHPHNLVRHRDVPDEGFALHLHSTYFGTQKTPHGYYVSLSPGYKRERITLGYPGFNLKKGSPMLSALLSRLFQLGKEHYAALNFDELEEDWGPDSRGRKVARPRRNLSAYQRSFDTHRHFEEILASVLDEFKAAPEEVKIGDQLEGLGSYLYVQTGAGRSRISAEEAKGHSQFSTTRP